MWCINKIFYKGFFPLPFVSNTPVASFSAYIQNRPVFSWFKKKKYALPFPSPAHQHTRRLHFLKVQRGFLSCTSTCHTSLSQLRERHSLKCAAGLCLLWIALVSQEPAFHVSDFSQGALMLIHFTLLAHLFFFRLLKNLLWAFKYICGKKFFWLSLCSFWKETLLIQYFPLHLTDTQF